MSSVPSQPCRRSPARTRREGRAPAFERLHEEHLDLSAGLTAGAQPRRHDARVVDDRQVPCKLVREVGEPPVPHLPSRTVDYEQARSIAARRRMLGDQVGREVVVELE